MNRRHLLSAALGALLMFGTAAAFSDVPELAVIVNKDNANSSVTKRQLAAIFKGRSTQFPNGAAAIAVNLPRDNALRQQFDSAVLALNATDVLRYWIDNRIRFGVGEPKKQPSEAAVIRFVTANAGGIGYVSKGEVTTGVRVVARLRAGQVVSP